MTMQRTLLSLLLLLFLPCTLAQAATLCPDSTAVPRDPVALPIDGVAFPADSVGVPADKAKSGSFVRRLVKGRVEHLREEYSIDSIRSIRDVDSILAEKYQKKGTYDTLYLARPTQRFTARARMNVSGASIHTQGYHEEKPYEGHLATPSRLTTSIGIAYRGFGVALSVNPGKLSGESHTTEFNFNYYANRYGGELTYVNSKDFSGWSKISDVRSEIPKDLMTSSMFYASGYYAFNYRRFSYPAAFTQSYIQRRSAGSWMVAATWMSGSWETKKIEGIGVIKMRSGGLGFGGGYGYNWVINEHWMVHGSALPTFVLGSFNRLTIAGHKEKVPYAFPEFIFTERIAALYQFQKNQFAGLTFVAYTMINGSRKDLRMSQTRWRLRVSYGIRF